MNCEQNEVLSVVESGHNVFITGQAGTGKSFLIGEIYQALKRRGEKIAIVCSSGIATTVHDGLGTYVRTVHSQYGLQTADLPSDIVVERSIANNLVRERVKTATCIIWDEVSMSSKRICEIVNRIHHLLAPEKDYLKPSGGKQVVVVGEFLQLRPVPNFFDEGWSIYESELFRKCLPHRYELLINMGQNSTEYDVLKCLKEIRLGQCSENSEELIRSLERDLQQNLDMEAVHIYFKKLPVQLHNLKDLRSMPGHVLSFDAIDEGDTIGIQCPAEKTVSLKPGCKIMLLWNKSERLRNGSPGTFLACEGESIVVEFPEVGAVRLERETWQKRAHDGKVVGSRRQFPVALMFAITCHKSQGLTIPAAVLHCSKEFVAGLSYVAMTRIRSCEHLQVLGFHANQLLAPSEEAINVCTAHLPPVEDCSCCREKELIEQDFVIEDDHANVQNEAIHSTDEVSEATENVIKSYFERGNPDESVIDLETVYLFLSEENQCDFVKRPPLEFDVESLLRAMKVAEPMSEFAEEKNREIETLLSLNRDTKLFGQVLWCRGCEIILEDSVCNFDELQISTKQWSVDTRQLFLLITRCPNFLRDLKLFFKSEEPAHVQRLIKAELMVEIYKTVVSTVVTQTKKGKPLIL